MGFVCADLEALEESFKELYTYVGGFIENFHHYKLEKGMMANFFEDGLTCFECVPTLNCFSFLLAKSEECWVLYGISLIFFNVSPQYLIPKVSFKEKILSP